MNLEALERHYSGGPTAVSRRLISDRDPRRKSYAKAQDIPGAMLSGGRFVQDHYEEVYQAELAKFSGRFVLVEMGVLLGVGLAMWCDLFPEARIIGLDIDPNRFDVEGLKAKGAFKKNTPEVHAFDELSPDASQRLGDILGGDTIDLFIDDALHDDRSILTAHKAVEPHLADDFVYIVEDNAHVGRMLPGKVAMRGRITVLRPQ